MTTTENQPSKKNKIFFWISTGLLALFVLPGIFFMNSPMALEAMARLDVPVWLHYEAGIGQPLAVLIILLPFFGKRVKEWAYVAMGIVYLSAFIAHLYVYGMAGQSFMPLVLFAVLLISYLNYHKLQRNN